MTFLFAPIWVLFFFVQHLLFFLFLYCPRYYGIRRETLVIKIAAGSQNVLV